MKIPLPQSTIAPSPFSKGDSGEIVTYCFAKASLAKGGILQSVAYEAGGIE